MSPRSIEHWLSCLSPSTAADHKPISSPNRAKNYWLRDNEGNNNKLLLLEEPGILPDSQPSKSMSRESTANATSASCASPLYRIATLMPNGVFIRLFNAELPQQITHQVNSIRQGRRQEGVNLDQHYKNIVSLSAKMDEEWKIEETFMLAVFPTPLHELYEHGLVHAKSMSLPSRYVPSNPSVLRSISQPKPDLAYGYSASPHPSSGLTIRQCNAGPVLATLGSSDSFYPFFVIEFKSDGGSICAAENQCAGDSTTCLEMVRRLNTAVANIHSTAEKVTEITYSAIINNRHGQILITWHDGCGYQVQECASFLFNRLEELHEMHHWIHRIIDWGIGERLNQVRAALDMVADHRDTIVNDDPEPEIETQPEPEFKPAERGCGKAMHPQDTHKPQRRSSRLRNK